jgi:adenylosuccinate lyase
VIPRYSRPEMAAVWSEARRFEVLLEIELLACEAMAELGEVPPEAARACRERARAPDPLRVGELEKTLKHDVIAFLTAAGESIGAESRFLHKGMTSSDVLDTATGVQLRDSCGLLISELDRVLVAVERRAREHKDTPCMGRSHGIHAEPTTFGWKLLGWHDELSRARVRLLAARDEVAVGMISGAVGTYAFVDPRVEQRVCERLGLRPAAVSTQVIPRDRHAAFLCALALLGASVERCAVEIRHLQRSEVLEAEEPFTAGQKGSSAMPHKRNPIQAENLSGLARLLRGYALPGLEDVALWHERDISHSSVERVVLPDASIAAHFMLWRFAALVEGLVVYPDRMRRNLELLGGLHHSQRVMLALVESGMGREDAYAAVQRHAMRVWAGEGALRDLLLADESLSSRLPPGSLQALFDDAAFVRHRDLVFSRVLGD